MLQAQAAAKRNRALEEEKKRQILAAATDLFLEFGYDGATLDMLIERIGGSRRTIYSLFGGKEGLLTAIVQDRCAGLGAKIETLSLEGLSPRDLLHKLGLEAAQTILSPEGVKLFRLVVQESGRNPELGRLMYENGVKVSQDLLADYFRRETKSGRLNVRYPDDAASMFFCMIKGDFHFIAMFWGFSDLTSARLQTRVERAVDLFWDGIKPVG
jgi:AcrR family transcriptional regulator